MVLVSNLLILAYSRENSSALPDEFDSARSFCSFLSLDHASAKMKISLIAS